MQNLLSYAFSYLGIIIIASWGSTEYNQRINKLLSSLLCNDLETLLLHLSVSLCVDRSELEGNIGAGVESPPSPGHQHAQHSGTDHEKV